MTAPSSVETEWVGLDSPTGFPSGGWGAHACQGIYYRPRASAPPVAFIASHYNLDFSEHYLGTLMAERGYGFLGWNTRFRGAEQYFLTDHAVAEIGAGVRWLKEHAGARTVVLLGNSGGASLMAAYQSHAASGTLGPLAGGRLARGLDDLIPGDLYISLAAHPGRAELINGCMDPSVTDENDPAATDPDLDMYDPRNGPPYSAEFQARYRQAQRDRNQRITAWVHSELARLRGAPNGTRDRLFAVPRLWADLRYLDPAIDPSNRPTPACWFGDPRRANSGVAGIGQVSTLRTWLSMWSVADTQCAGQDHLPHVTVPSLVIGADADTGVFPSHTQAIYDYLGATDKEVHTLPGDHYFREPARARDAVADLIATWLAKHT